MNKVEAIQENMVVLAKSKSKSAKMRSKMLKMIMPLLSRETGKDLAEAIHKRNKGLFDKVWMEIKNIVDDKLESTSSSSDGDVEAFNIEEAYTVLSSAFSAEAKTANDNSKVFVGNAMIPAKTRELAANGRAVMEDVNGVLYSLVITAVVMRKTSNVHNPEVKMRAELINVANSTSKVITVNGEMGLCYMDLIIKSSALM